MRTNLVGVEEGEVQEVTTLDKHVPQKRTIDDVNTTPEEKEQHLTSAERKKMKKARKKAAAALAVGRGTREQCYDLYGESAMGSILLKDEEIYKGGRKQLKISHIHELILWILGEVPAPRWVFVKNRVLVERVCFVLVDGLTAPVFDRVVEFMPKLAALDQSVSIMVPASLYEPQSVLKSVANVSSSTAYSKKEQKKRKGSGSPSSSASGSSKKSSPVDEYVLTEDQLDENGYPLSLSEEEGYVQTEPAPEPRPSGWVSPMIAVDCEMCGTQNGLQLARLTLVDANGEELYDEMVLTTDPITNYNTQYSGITADMMEGVTTTLQDAQKAFKSFVAEDVILVGHSVENDLKSLRIVHKRVVDTALLYPHVRGHPYKNSLRWLTKRYLQRDIQNSGNGHCSAEDARAALQLAQLKVAKGRDFGIISSDSEGIFQLLAKHRRKSTLIAPQQSIRAVPSRPATTMPSVSDSEVANKCTKALTPGGSEFVFCHMDEFMRKFEAADVMEDEKESKEQIEEISRALDEQLNRICSKAPRHSALIIMGGQGPVSRVKALQKKQVQFKTGEVEEFVSLSFLLFAVTAVVAVSISPVRLLVILIACVCVCLWHLVHVFVKIGCDSFRILSGLQSCGEYDYG